MAAAAFVVSGVAVYLSYRTAQKQRQKNKTKPSQFDTTLADEGVSCSRIGGSPHMYGNLVEVWDKSSAEIKKKAGGK